MKRANRAAAPITTSRRLHLLHERMGYETSPLRANGFSLIELLVVVIIVGILAGLGMASFEGLVTKYNVDNQMRRMHADLSNVKIMAMSKGRTHFLTLSASGYTAYDDTNENETLNTGTDPVVLRSNQALNLSTVTTQQFSSITWAGGAGIDFNPRGLCTTAAPAQTVCVFSSVTPRYDCIKVSPTRIVLGKLAAQGVCSAANCQTQ